MAATVCRTLVCCRARFQTALGRQLIDKAVGQRIAERHAQFKYVNTNFIELQGQPPGHFEAGVARPDIDDKPFLPVLFQPGKPLLDSIHTPADFNAKAQIRTNCEKTLRVGRKVAKRI